uniref:Polycystin cation channel PKD1/PKD2 domain-containing protein n=1 Tax=Pyrodinium bahamense TaxID=73915 RepID=A0A7S0A5J0_9DINO
MEGFCADPSPGDQRLRRRLSPKGMAEGPKLGAGVWNVVGDVTGAAFSVVFHGHEGLEHAISHLEQLKKHTWIDEQSSWVGIRAFVLNPDLSVYSNFIVNMFLLPSGELIPVVQASSFLAEPYQYKGIVALDVIWLILWFQLFVQRVWSFFWACYKSGRRLSYCLNFWMLVEWLATVMGLVLIILWLVYLEKLDWVKEASMTVAFNRPVAGVPAAVLDAYDSAVQRLHQEVADFDGFIGFFRLYVAAYAALLMMHLFKALEVQPRLAIIMQTVVQCLPDVLHFGVVLLTMHSAFVLAAVFLVGHRMLMFSTFWLAFQECSLMLLGDVGDYTDIAAEHPVTAFLWFFTFIVVMFMIMLNMILAIFMDIYGGMKQHASVSETLPEQILMIFHGIRHQTVPSYTVLESVEALNVEMVDRDVLMEACPELGAKQADDLINKVEMAEEQEDEETLTLSDAFRMVGSTYSTIQAIMEQVNEIVEQQRGTIATILEAVGPSGPAVLLHVDSEEQLCTLEDRVEVLEEFLNEVMSYLVLRGKEARVRMEAMEKALRAGTLQDTWRDRYREWAAASARSAGAVNLEG